MYKEVLTMWLNVGKDNRPYYAIRNETEQTIVIEPGKSIYININNKRPIATKSVKVEEQTQEQSSDDLSKDIPF